MNTSYYFGKVREVEVKLQDELNKPEKERNMRQIAVLKEEQKKAYKMWHKSAIPRS